MVALKSGTGAVLIEKGWPQPGGDPSGNGEETQCAGTGTRLRSQLSGRLFLCRTRGVVGLGGISWCCTAIPVSHTRVQRLSMWHGMNNAMFKG